jgi:ribosome-associated protein
MSLAAKKTTRVATNRRAKVIENPARDLALAIAQAGFDKKATDVEIIDVTGKVDYADFVVVMSATSDRQANAIAKNIDSTLSLAGHRANSIEGLPQGAWVLMDYGDVVVHIFHQDTRGYYDLEALWSDAERVEVVDQKRA